MRKSRGFRNNNPLNIRRGASHWVGQCEVQTDKAFVQFTSMAYGYRAAWKVLSSYYRRFHTLEKRPFNVRNIISRWAPPGDHNNTQGYISSVLLLIARMPTDSFMRNIDGVPETVSIGSEGGWENLMAPETTEGYLQLRKLLWAMTCIENGCSLREVSLMDIKQGYRLAFGRWPRCPNNKSSPSGELLLQ